MSALTVPARFVTLFREGVKDSLRIGVGFFDTVVAELTTTTRVEDLRSALRQATEDVDLFAAVPADPDGDVTVQAGADVLAHALESTARAVCGPRLTDRLGVGPFERDLIAEIVVLTDAIEWSAEQADHYHILAADERASRKGA